MQIFLIALFLSFSGGASSLYADDVIPSLRPTLEESNENSSVGLNGKKPTPRGKKIGEKEIQGTEALNRFESNTVIKSKYMLNGIPLEVDPD